MTRKFKLLLLIPNVFLSFSVLKPVEKYTVFEIVLQLYEQPWLSGMDDPDNLNRLNMTDQMIHLIGTRFKRIFGEAYYRLVVMDLYPSYKSMIVRSAILLDPSIDNIYHATNIWFSTAGFVTLGRFPLLPDNIYLIESRMVWEKYHRYLNGLCYA